MLSIGSWPADTQSRQQYAMKPEDGYVPGKSDTR